MGRKRAIDPLTGPGNGIPQQFQQHLTANIDIELAEKLL